MPIKIEYSNDEIGVILYHIGIVTEVELIDAISSVYRDERYINLKYWIADRSECTETQLDTNGIKEIAALNQRESLRNPGILLAMISPQDYDFGVSRMFEAHSDKDLFKTRVFRDKESADDWIKQNLQNP